MLNAIIRFALHQRLLVICLSLLLVGLGAWQATQMPIDVFPNLNRPRVVVMVEAHNLAPEEVETLITFPIESAVNGANGVQAVRSSSGPGIAIINVEFDWGTDIYIARQIVNERLAIVKEKLPDGIEPQLAPISSLMGQIIMAGMWSEDPDADPMEVRTYADWVVRQRLLTIPGVSQVFVMGGGRKQFQVLVLPDEMRRYNVTLKQIKQAMSESNLNASGGYLDEQGPNELLVRGLGRIQSVEDLKKVVVAERNHQPIPLERVARVIEGPQVKRGDSSARVRVADGSFAGGPAVILTINKQPDADTREVTELVQKAIEEIRKTLPGDYRLEANLYTQREFIDRAIDNVIEAVRDGGLLVILVLVLFLMNVRTCFITLTSLPVTLGIASLVFAAFDLSINTMTLGGLAVAMGELMDDAIVDVENIYRRLGENRHAEHPLNPLLVVFRASAEIRNSIVFGTMIVAVGFIPLFALEGMVGLMFAPLGIAYIVTVLSSLIVSLTLTPALSSLLLPQAIPTGEEKDNFVVRPLKWAAGWLIRFSLWFRWPVILTTATLVLVAALFAWNLEQDLLPPFDEGVAQLNVVLQPGTSLEESNKIGALVERRLMEIDDVQTIIRRTGRAELDEHAVGVNTSELIISFDPNTHREREAILEDIRHSMEDIPGIVISVEQPLAHLIAHMLSGVTAQVSIKIYGDDLEKLRKESDRMLAEIKAIRGVKDAQVEPMTEIPQIRLELDRDQLLLYGVSAETVNEFVETAMNGEVVSTIFKGQQQFDLVVRLDEPYREDLEQLRRLPVETPDGNLVPLEALAKIYEARGPNQITRESVQRRQVVTCNVSGRGLVDVVEDIKRAIQPIQAQLPDGYSVEFSGLYEAEQEASRRLVLLGILVLFGIFLILYTMFRSASFSLQIMAALPMAFIGSIFALTICGETLSTAAKIGFISLGGIASRNGILLLDHYLYRVQHEGDGWTHEMIIRAGQERLVPVIMTALTSVLGLIPLLISGNEPGKEILYPIAVVHVGGLLTCTLLEFMVRPALFWTFGVKSAQQLTDSLGSEVPLEEEPLFVHQTEPEPASSTH